jgi:hypothetical protein
VHEFAGARGLVDLPQRGLTCVIQDDRPHGGIVGRLASRGGTTMAIKLHRCSNLWVKIGGHPCWRVQRALDDMGIEYEVVKEPYLKSKRQATLAATGQKGYPWIEFEDGKAYRAESKEMEQKIREGKLFEGHEPAPATPSAEG